MKNLILIVALIFSAAVSAQEKPKVVDASCGQCQFGMAGSGCTLAVKIDGKPYFVEGTDINKHGDAHAHDGFCSAVRQAEITGSVVDGKFQAKSFKLLPAKKK